MSIPAPGEARALALDELLASFIGTAVHACRQARRAGAAADSAREKLALAKTGGGFWIESLEARAQSLSREAAELLVGAHARAEEAEGVVRAVRLARSGQVWTPFNVRAAAETLFFGERRSA